LYAQTATVPQLLSFDTRAKEIVAGDKLLKHQIDYVIAAFLYYHKHCVQYFIGKSKKQCEVVPVCSMKV